MQKLKLYDCYCASLKIAIGSNSMRRVVLRSEMVGLLSYLLLQSADLVRLLRTRLSSDYRNQAGTSR